MGAWGGRRSGKSAARSAEGYLLLVVVLLLGAWLRLYKIDEVGLAGSDTVYYTNIAQAWSEGTPVYQAVEFQTLVYRPVVFAIFGGAVRLLGFHDTSIKLANAAVDLINLGLLFTSCWLLSRKDPWPAAAAALIYACSPMAVEMARVELTHVISTLMVLLALLFFLLHEASGGVWRRRGCLILSAVFTGFAVLSHEELVLTAVGYAVFLGLVFLRSARARCDFEALVLHLVLYAGFLLATCGSAFLLHKDFVVSKVALGTGRGALTTGSTYFKDLAKLLWNGILAHGSAFLLGLFVVFFAVAVLRMLFSKVEREVVLLLLPGILLLCYAAGYVKLLSFFRIRIFFPLFPLVILFVVIWWDHLLAWSGAGATWRRRLVLLIALLAMFFNLGNYQNKTSYEGVSLAYRLPVAAALPFDPRPGLRQVRATIYEKSWARKIVDELAGKVGEDARLLVTSSISQPYPGRRVFQVDYYFGDNAVYLFDHQEPLADLVWRYKIKYVLFTTRDPKPEYANKNEFVSYAYGGKWLFKRFRTLGASYGFKAGGYSMRREWESLRTFLEGRSATLLYANGQEQMAIKGPLAQKSVDLLYELRE